MWHGEPGGLPGISLRLWAPLSTGDRVDVRLITGPSVEGQRMSHLGGNRCRMPKSSAKHHETCVCLHNDKWGAHGHQEAPLVEVRSEMHLNIYRSHRSLTASRLCCAHHSKAACRTSAGRGWPCLSVRGCPQSPPMPTNHLNMDGANLGSAIYSTSYCHSTKQAWVCAAAVQHFDFRSMHSDITTDSCR